VSDQQAREQEDARLQALAKLAARQANRVVAQRQKQLADQEALLERASELRPFVQLAVEHVQSGAKAATGGGGGPRGPQQGPAAQPTMARSSPERRAPAAVAQMRARAPRAAARPSAAAGTR
jgi:hypothetical protein